MSDSMAFMDHAESLGVRPILEMVAAYFAQPENTSAPSRCSCGVSPFWAMQSARAVLLNATHDLTCPIHRIIVLCGSKQDRAALADRSERFALECLRIVAAPERETVQDFEFATSIVSNREIRHV